MTLRARWLGRRRLGAAAASDEPWHTSCLVERHDARRALRPSGKGGRLEAVRTASTPATCTAGTGGGSAPRTLEALATGVLKVETGGAYTSVCVCITTRNENTKTRCCMHAPFGRARKVRAIEPLHVHSRSSCSHSDSPPGRYAPPLQAHRLPRTRTLHPSSMLHLPGLHSVLPPQSLRRPRAPAARLGVEGIQLRQRHIVIL